MTLSKDTENYTYDMLVGFAERNNSRIMNAFFDRKTNKKWTWEIPNGETKEDIYSILTNELNTVKNVAILNTLKSSDHKMEEFKVTLDLRQRGKLFRMKKPNISTVKEKSDEFAIRI